MRSICENESRCFSQTKSYLYRDLRIGLAHVQRVYAAAKAVGYGP